MFTQDTQYDDNPNTSIQALLPKDISTANKSSPFKKSQSPRSPNNYNFNIQDDDTDE
jgi:hypothetical protein